jgi:iron complex transport system ATP-binding protein
MAELRADALTLRAGDKVLVDDVSIAFRPGELTAIIGENGAGKSSLLRMLSGYQRPDAGSVTVDGRDLASFPPLDRARRIGWLPQILPPALPVTVADAVALGRFAHGGAPHSLGDADRKAVHAAIGQCGLGGMETRSTATLSGGELARVHLARAIAAGTPVMLVDEPIASLDPRYRLEAMMLLLALAEAEGRTMVAVLHDVGLAARFADRIIVMRAGRVLADGPARDIITPAVIEEAFGASAVVTTDAGWPQPLFVAPLSPGAGAPRRD